MPANITLVPISQLPLYPNPLAANMRLAVEGAGATYGATVRQFVLPADPLLTAVDFTSSLPASRFIQAGAGVSIVDGGAGHAVIISASSSGQIVVLNLDAAAALAGTQENFNGGNWDQGNSKSRFAVTPGVLGVMGGLDATLAVDGQFISMSNESATVTFDLTHDSAGSLAANRFLCPGAGTFTIVPYQVVLLLRQGSRWRIVS